MGFQFAHQDRQLRRVDRKGAGNLSRLDPLVIALQGFEDRADLGKDVKALVFGQQVDKGRQFTVGRFAGQSPE